MKNGRKDHVQNMLRKVQTSKKNPVLMYPSPKEETKFTEILVKKKKKVPD